MRLTTTLLTLVGATAFVVAYPISGGDAVQLSKRTWTDYPRAEFDQAGIEKPGLDEFEGLDNLADFIDGFIKGLPNHPATPLLRDLNLLSGRTPRTGRDMFTPHKTNVHADHKVNPLEPFQERIGGPSMMYLSSDDDSLQMTDGTYRGISVKKEGRSFRQNGVTYNKFRSADYSILGWNSGIKGFAESVKEIGAVMSTSVNGKTVAEYLVTAENNLPATNPLSGKLTNALDKITRAASLRRDAIAARVSDDGPVNLDREAWGQNIQGANHGPAFNGLKSIGKPLWMAKNPNKVVNGEPTSGPYDPNNGSCRGGRVSKRGLDKRADSGGICAAPIKIVNGDTLGAKEMDDGSIARSEIDGLWDLKQATGLEEILDGYTGEGVPMDADDYTELDHNMIWKGSDNLDDALGKLDDAVSGEMDKDFKKIDKPTFARGIQKLKAAVRSRIAVLKSLLGNIKGDKQVTAESRLKTWDKLDNKYTGKTGKTTFEDDPRNEDLFGPDENGRFADFGEMSTQSEFGDYRSTEEQTSIAEADAIAIASEIIPEELSSPDGAPSIDEGGEAFIDITRAVPGTNEYHQVWNKIRVGIKNKLSLSKIPKWMISRANSLIAKLDKSAGLRERAITNKLDRGEEVKEQEVMEYNAISDARDGLAEDVKTVGFEKVDQSDVKPALDFAPESRGPLEISAPKKTFTAKSGFKSTFKSGIKSFADSTRQFKNKLSSTRGTRRPGSPNM